MTRRQPVAEGGLFTTPKATFSNETHQLLKGNNLCDVVSELWSFYCTSDDAGVEIDQLPTKASHRKAERYVTASYE